MSYFFIMAILNRFKTLSKYFLYHNLSQLLRMRKFLKNLPSLTKTTSIEVYSWTMQIDSSV